MGYPKYAYGLKPVCMRVTKLKPMCIVEQRGDSKSVRVLVSELNPPICALIREMAQGGTKGSVPITFASTETMARVCPPPPCPCKPCPVLTPFQKFLKNFILGSKIVFLGGSIILMWYVGGLGPTMDSWNLKECVKNYYYACNNIQYKYKDKCHPVPEPDKGPICYDTQTPWNRNVVNTFNFLNCMYFMMHQQIKDILNYENCDYEKPKKPDKAAKKDAKKEAKPDYSKIYRSLYSSLDPINIPCDEPPDYFAGLFEAMREGED